MALTVPFRGVPGDDAAVARPLLDLRLADVPELPVTCLLDSGAIGNWVGRWVADVAGLDLSQGPRRRLSLGGTTVEAVDVEVDLRLGEHVWTAPVSFCDPWPAPFGLLGQEGFLGFFVAELRAAERLTRLTPATA